MMLLQACLNGARRPDEHPGIPITAAALARDVVAVVEAGAGAVHLHVKDPSGSDTFGAAELTAVLAAVRRAAPGLPVGVTTGAWALPNVSARIAAVGGWPARPDFASVNWHEDGADEVAGVLLARGIGVEAGLWHAAGVDAWLASPHRDRCLRILLELPDGLDGAQTGEFADRLLRRLRTGVADRSAACPPILLHGEGSSCWPALEVAARLGWDTRIGLEDTLDLPDGSPAPGNAALVLAARRIIAANDRLATAADHERC